jgi:hypothetical protein
VGAHPFGCGVETGSAIGCSGVFEDGKKFNTERTEKAGGISETAGKIDYGGA